MCIRDSGRSVFGVVDPQRPTVPVGDLGVVGFVWPAGEPREPVVGGAEDVHGTNLEAWPGARCLGQQVVESLTDPVRIVAGLGGQGTQPGQAHEARHDGAAI